MPGERPSYIPPENPFGSSEGKLPPEPTAQFVERFLGKQAVGPREAKELEASDDLLTAEERTEAEHQAREARDLALIIGAERDKLSNFFGREIEIPSLPPEITRERIERWREQGFEVHYLPRTEVSGREPGMRTPLAFDEIEKSDIDRFGSDWLSPTELPGTWVLIDGRPKPAFRDTSKGYPNDAEFEAALHGTRFNKSWDLLHEPGTVSMFAGILGVDAARIRLPRAIEYNVLANLHHYLEWREGNSLEWFEDTTEHGTYPLRGGSVGLLSDMLIYSSDTDDTTGFRLLVVLS